MHRFGILATSGLVAIAALAAGQSAPTPAPSAGSAVRARPSAEMESVTGTVKKYREGKSIVIVGPDGRGRKLVLDGTTRIDGPVRRGQAVTAVWMTDDAGRPHVNAISTYPRAAAGAETTATSAAAAETTASASPSLVSPSASAPPPEPTPHETAVAPTATPHGPSEDATTPSARRTPVPGAP